METWVFEERAFEKPAVAGDGGYDGALGVVVVVDGGGLDKGRSEDDKDMYQLVEDKKKMGLGMKKEEEKKKELEMTEKRLNLRNLMA
ncbi:hypothetical protein L6164_036076 [Bauhinia variegata]|uniref:Uncharacterized protein n=1 Tax=Bauhinia variegata TaxID=167791 RepID=A0ACB9KFZ0_BAUVA|nr:hypothetical protein L6164_036076 [Bauhinia variegata]